MNKKLREEFNRSNELFSDYCDKKIGMNVMVTCFYKGKLYSKAGKIEAKDKPDLKTVDHVLSLLKEVILFKIKSN